MSASTRNRPWAFDAELIKRNLSELKSVYHPGVRNSEVKIQEEIEAAHRKSSERCKMRIPLSNEHQVCWGARKTNRAKARTTESRVQVRKQVAGRCRCITQEGLDQKRGHHAPPFPAWHWVTPATSPCLTYQPCVLRTFTSP